MIVDKERLQLLTVDEDGSNRIEEASIITRYTNLTKEVSYGLDYPTFHPILMAIPPFQE